ncbi:MAG: Flp family type IVb pilin [Syntrophomonadaceae bacterium]|jgi:pilus assembly protein Flp/PilA
MLQVLKRLVLEDEGQGMAEYGLILALISIVVIIALTPMGEAIRDKMQAVSTAITNAGTAAPAGP